jgi:hypothetical protein
MKEGGDLVCICRIVVASKTVVCGCNEPIQKGVPTNVLRREKVENSCAETPKSAKSTIDMVRK